MTEPAAWLARQAGLAELATRQIFLVDGQPRSGTTWLQHLLDAHPAISCRGEAAFGDHLAAPLTAMMRARRQELEGRNAAIFAHSGGYPPPQGEDVRHLFGTAMLLAMARQIDKPGVHAIGEKTPGNIALFDELRLLFPGARLIGIARDPRDMIASNWHRFHAAQGGTEQHKQAFLDAVLSESDRWLRTMLSLRAQAADAYHLITYESLHDTPIPVLRGLFGFLGVAADDDVARACLDAADFARLSGRPPGTAENGSFFRRGTVGGWQDTLSPAMNRQVLDALGWSFAAFGWTP